MRASPQQISPKFKAKISTKDRSLLNSAEYESEILQELRSALKQCNDRKTSFFDIFAPMVNIQSSGTVMSFQPYDFQSQLIREVEQNVQTVITKSRQMGISETICCYLLMRAVTEPGFAAIVFSKTQDDSAKLGKRIRDMAISLGHLCPKLTTESAKKLAFYKLGCIDFLPVTARSARGIPSVSVLFFDEAAFIDGIDGVYQAAVPTLSMLGNKAKVIFNSTPNGRSGLFYRLMSGPDDEKKAVETCKEIGQASNSIKPFDRLASHTRSWVNDGWAKVFLHWRAHPIYGKDPDWATKTRIDRKLTQAQWDQEYELAFSEGNASVYPASLIDGAAIGQWALPIDRGQYIVGIDPSFGGADSFVAQVWEVRRGHYSLVSEYSAAHTSKTVNIARVIELIDLYNPINANIEINSGGGIILEDLIKKRPGIRWNEVVTSNRSKIENTDRTVLMMERELIAFPAGSQLHEQLSHFVEQIGTKINSSTRVRMAESGYHDDAVMAFAIAFANMDEWAELSGQSNALEGILN